MHITLTDEEIEKMDLNEIHSRLNEAQGRRDMLLKRRGELDEWLREAYSHIERLNLAKARINQEKGRRDSDLLMQEGSRGDVKPKEPGRICTNWHECPRCHARRDPDPRGRCPECGVVMAVMSSKGW